MLEAAGMYETSYAYSWPPPRNYLLISLMTFYKLGTLCSIDMFQIRIGTLLYQGGRCITEDGHMEM
jgi:hypothetical protein